ncbi:MAG: benzene/toluene monooxygenase ferredoxin subunit [Actinomycetota bacterium]
MTSVTYTRLCSLDDLWEGEMEAFEIDGHEVLVMCVEGGGVRAYQGTCPHQDIALVEGSFDGRLLVCRAHQWVFDATTGHGVNPDNCRLAEYPVRVDGDEVLVDTAGITPLFAAS